jgi:hypothetical protein
MTENTRRSGPTTVTHTLIPHFNSFIKEWLHKNKVDWLVLMEDDPALLLRALLIPDKLPTKGLDPLWFMRIDYCSWTSPHERALFVASTFLLDIIPEGVNKPEGADKEPDMVFLCMVAGSSVFSWASMGTSLERSGRLEICADGLRPP